MITCTAEAPAGYLSMQAVLIARIERHGNRLAIDLGTASHVCNVRGTSTLEIGGILKCRQSRGAYLCNSIPLGF
jgi:hypothetical protein